MYRRVSDTYWTCPRRTASQYQEYLVDDSRNETQFLAGGSEELSLPDLIAEPGGPFHDFWLLRETECPYHETERYPGRTDAPIRLSCDLLEYIGDSLRWFPVTSPGRRTHRRSQGLYFYGPNIIDQEGGQRFSGIFGAWADLFSQGPDPLVLSTGFNFELNNEEQLVNPQQAWMRLDREWIVAELRILTDWGTLAAKGEQYILHLGI